MEEKEVFDRVKKVVVAQLGVAPDSVTMATSFTKDLGADADTVIELEGVRAGGGIWDRNPRRRCREDHDRW